MQLICFSFVPQKQKKVMKTQEPLTYLLGQTMKLVRHKLMAKFKENNIELTLEQFVVLHYINENSESTQQDLANHFLRDKSIVTRQINTLIDLGYVMRTQDDDDKRKKHHIPLVALKGMSRSDSQLMAFERRQRQPLFAGRQVAALHGQQAEAVHRVRQHFSGSRGSQCIVDNGPAFL